MPNYENNSLIVDPLSADDIYEINTKDWITKSNAIIESQYKLSLQEQRILLITASKVQPSDEDFKPYKFRVSDLIDKIGASKKSSMYSYIREVVTGLQRKTLSYKKGTKTIVANWLVTSIYEDNEGTVILKFNPDLKEFFLHLKEKFTMYQLENVIQLNSVYSVRIYELLKQYESIRKRTFTLEEFREKLGIEPSKYKQYGHLKNKVITVAQQEIGEKTDIKFEFEETKKGRKVTGLIFRIESNLVENDIKKLKKPPQQLNFMEDLDREEIKDRLQALKVSKSKWDYILENYSPEQILRNIQYAEERVGSVNSIGGYTYNAIKNDYAASKPAPTKKKPIRQEMIPDYMQDIDKEYDPEYQLKQYESMYKDGFENYLLKVYELKARLSDEAAEREVKNIIDSDYNKRTELGLKPRFIKEFDNKFIKNLYKEYIHTK